jgi:hypothetical protein
MHVEVMPIEVLGVGLRTVGVCLSLGISRIRSMEVVDLD